MIRSVKYGLYGAVLAGVVSGTVAWQSVDKTVHLVVDGNRSTIHTTQSDVADVLSGAGYKVGPHDIVAPQADARVKNGGTVVLARGRLLLLDVNGVQSQVWTTASTVAGAMAQLGYSTADFTSVSRDRRLPLSPTDLTIRTPQSVIVKHDGRTDKVATTDVTVAQLLDDLGMELGPKDTVEPAAATAITSGMTVTVHRVVNTKESANVVLHYGTTVQYSSSLGAGTSAVVKLGHDGSARDTYAIVMIDGKVVGKTLVGTKVLTQPINKVVIVGTGTPPATGGSAGAATVNVPAGAIASPAQAMDIARQMLAARGWSDQMDNCLVPMWEHESGWRVQAGNSSGAYGIPQALPGYKMASAGADWQTNAATQITWGLNYIAAHYGTPCAAWSFWQGHSYY